MTVVALLAEPPREGRVLSDLVDAGTLSAPQAAELYAAMVQDVASEVARSGGELLLNHPPADDVPGDDDPAPELRNLLGDVLQNVDDVRFEVQVGSTEAARVGNTVTHLLEGEDVDSAAVLWPTAPFVDRTVIDGAAMKLRRDEVVLGAAPDGRLYYAAFTEPVDFADALEPPAVRTVAKRAADAGHGLNFQHVLPLVAKPADLEQLTTFVEARSASEEYVPAVTAATLADFGLLDDDAVDALFD